MLVFSFWYEDAEIRHHLLKKITKDLIECSKDNTKIWVLLGLSFPCYSNHFFISKQSRVNIGCIEKSRTIIGKSNIKKSVPIHYPDIINTKIPRYYYNGYLIRFFENGKVINSKNNFFSLY